MSRNKRINHFNIGNVKLFGIIPGETITNILFKAIEIVSTTDEDILEIIDNSSTTIAFKATKIGSTTLILASITDPIIT